jgi:hypothetical protein
MMLNGGGRCPAQIYVASDKDEAMREQDREREGKGRIERHVIGIGRRKEGKITSKRTTTS